VTAMFTDLTEAARLVTGAEDAVWNELGDEDPGAAPSDEGVLLGAVTKLLGSLKSIVLTRATDLATPDPVRRAAFDQVVSDLGEAEDRLVRLRHDSDSAPVQEARRA
jgi:hypothetical protein